jgi:hypothetical protein
MDWRLPLTFVAAAGYILLWAIFLLWAILLAVLARRFLRLRAGPVRLPLPGVAGLVVSVLAVGQLIRTTPEARWAFVPLWIGVGVLDAMALLILTETRADARPP